MKAHLTEEERPRASVSATTVGLSVTIATLVVIIVGGCFMYFSMVSRINHLENKLMFLSTDDVQHIGNITREKRQIYGSHYSPSRGACYVCPPSKPGPRGPRGFPGKHGRPGKPGLKGPRGLRGKDGVCDCDYETTTVYDEPIGGDYDTTTESYATSTEYEEEKGDAYTTQGGYDSSTTTDYDDNKGDKGYESTTTDSYNTSPDVYGSSTTDYPDNQKGDGYKTTTYAQPKSKKQKKKKPSYDTTTNGYQTSSTTTVDPGPLKGRNKGYRG